jgi:hypothetical protein
MPALLTEVCRINGGSGLVGDHRDVAWECDSERVRPGFHLVAHRALPLPVGSSDLVR